MKPTDTPLKLYEYQEGKTVKWVNSQMDASYFGSLLHKHNEYEKPIETKEELLRDNEMHFVEGPSANADGPFKYMD